MLASELGCINWKCEILNATLQQWESGKFSEQRDWQVGKKYVTKIFQNIQIQIVQPSLIELLHNFLLLF